MRQWHYLLMYDTETKEWYHDVETESDNFPSGMVFDSELNQWVNEYVGDGEFLKDTDFLTGEINSALSFLNSRNGEQ